MKKNFPLGRVGLEVGGIIILFFHLSWTREGREKKSEWLSPKHKVNLLNV